MHALKVPLKYAEKAKKYLLDNNLYNKKYKAKRRKKHIFFPVLKKTRITKFNALYEDIQLEKIIKKNYKDHLKSKLTEKQIIDLPSSYDVIGSIIIIDIPDNLVKKEKQISQALLQIHKNVKTILKKSGIHEGEFRTQKLAFLAGRNTRETIYRENNIILKLNVEKAYFSPRLSTERKRIYNQVKKEETILVMFSGVGVYPLVIAKNTSAKKIIGIEKNPVAHEYASENLRLNKMKDVDLLLGDVRKIIPKLQQKFDRIIMPLPKDSEQFLDLAFKVSKRNTIIHFYDFEHETELKRGEEKVKKACTEHMVKCGIIRTIKCGQYSPGKFRLCVDFQIKGVRAH